MTNVEAPPTEEDFGLVNRNQIFSFFNFQSSAKMPVGGVSL